MIYKVQDYYITRYTGYVEADSLEDAQEKIKNGKLAISCEDLDGGEMFDGRVIMENRNGNEIDLYDESHDILEKLDDCIWNEVYNSKGGE